MFSTKYNLHVHIKNIHEIGFEIKTCELCSAKFKRRGDLNRHMKIHSTESFDCKYCDKKFSFKCNLFRHIKSLHLE